MRYYAVGVDVTEIVDRNQGLSGDPLTARWHCVYTGREPVLLPPDTFDLWKRAHTEAVTDEELDASLSFEPLEDSRDYLRDDVLGKLAFVAWPWYHSGSTYADAMQLALTGTRTLPNPDPDRIPNALWHNAPTIAELERAYQDSGFSFGSARHGLIQCLPSWMSTYQGALRFHVVPFPTLSRALA